MDNNCVAILQDYQDNIEKSFKKIEKEIKEYSNSDSSKLDLIKETIASAKTNLGIMKIEIPNLKNENNKQKWEDTIQQLELKINEYKSQVNDLKKKNNNNNNNNNVEDEMVDINKKVDIKQLTSQQAIQRGHNLLNDNKKRFGSIKKVIKQDIDMLKEDNKELKRQEEVIDNVDDNLKEIDFSLKRAGQQIKSMFKMYATDKLILCLIFVIVLIIISIIIASIVKKNKKANNTKNNENLAKDIFKQRRLKFLWDIYN